MCETDPQRTFTLPKFGANLGLSLHESQLIDNAEATTLNQTIGQTLIESNPFKSVKIPTLY